MAIEIERLIVRLIGDTSQYTRALDQAVTRTQHSFRTIDGSVMNLARSFRSLGTAMTIGFTFPVAAVGASAVHAAIQMDEMRRSLTSIIGSAEGAEDALKRVRDIAKLPGVTMRGAARDMIALLATGKVGMELVERTLKGFGAAAAEAGRGEEEVRRALEQVIQMVGQGKVLLQDVRIMRQHIPQLGKAMQEVFGTNIPKEIQEMGIGPEQFLEGVVHWFEKNIKATVSARGEIEKLGDAWFIAMAKVGEAMVSLAPAIEIVAGWVEQLGNWFQSLDKNTQKWILAAGLMIVVAGPLIGLISSLAVAMAALVTVGLPFAGVMAVAAAALAALGVGVVGVKKLLDSAGKAAEEAVKKAKSTLSGGAKPLSFDLSAIKASRAAAEELEDEIKSLTKEMKRLEEAAKSPFELIEDKIKSLTRAFALGIVDMDTFRKIAEDLAMDRLELEMKEAKKLEEPLPKAGGLALRGSVEEFKALRESETAMEELKRSTLRSERLAERRTRLLEEILAKIAPAREPPVVVMHSL